ncbi:unnamed protein product [Brassica oleracea]|uniref:(rape) hypothetical protein n=1 Tax=Brassica napus TaxID=3708 RepID=A0A816Q3M0_BRANA|nr:unnamed protein product [Brassica napus]
MGSRSESEDQSTFDPHYSPPNTVDFATQEVLATLAAADKVANQIASQEAGVTRADGKQQGSRKRLISLVGDTDDSDVENSQPTQKTKPRRQTSFGTATRKPMLQSTIDDEEINGDGDGEEEKLPTFEYVVEQPAAPRSVLLHSFRVQPAGRLVRHCAIGRYGIGPTFWRPQPARDGTARTREMTSPQRFGTGRDGPTCLTSLLIFTFHYKKKSTLIADCYSTFY